MSALARRSAGVLLHVTSLPGDVGTGDLGAGARAFVDFLAQAGQRWWQTLPIHPVGAGDSPYSGRSAFAGNPWLISLTDLAQEGLLIPSEIPNLEQQVDREKGKALRSAALAMAFTRFRSRSPEFRAALDELRDRARYWLEDYTLFCAASEVHQGRPWTEWDQALARRALNACRQAREAWSERVAYFEFEQLIFDRQWRALRAYARERGVLLIGDAPIFVAHASADVWAHQANFRLDPRGEPTHVSGVPPDAFSATGQRWGTPLYRWKRLARTDFEFWRERIARELEHYDVIRLDHFIGFARYWEIAAEAEDATSGRWMRGPGAALFESLQRDLNRRGLTQGRALPLIAEDLGCVNRAVRALRDQFDLPGMRVLQFAFGDAEGTNEHLPHRHPRNCVAYTGTHDNDTTQGWFEDTGELGQRSAAQCQRDRAAVVRYLRGPEATQLDEPAHLALIRALYAGPARTVIVPMQDWLGLASEARMNVPGRAEGNWGYRLDRQALTTNLAERMRSYVRTYGREPPARESM